MNNSDDLKNSDTATVRWLHLSDIHFGMDNQKWMWPTLKQIFLDDLRSLHQKYGPWDLVIFSGDLTQRGEDDEFDRLTHALSEIWQCLRELGSDPLLFPVPGNHDLVRPNGFDSSAMVMKRWWDDRSLHEHFWNSPSCEYRKLVNDAFSSYNSWLSGIESAGIRLPKMVTGLLPGDISAAIKIRSFSIGLVGLNSAWLQLGGGNYEEKLHVDPRQLMEVTGYDPDAWCDQNVFNLLVTHHPTTWLHPDSRDSWYKEIDTQQRFDAHLYGHMHEPNFVSTSSGGFAAKRFVQCASLFGLEKFGEEGKEIRRHGYSLSELSCGNSLKRIKVWPRKVHRRLDGSLGLVPDFDFNTNNDGLFEYVYSSDNPVSDVIKIPGADEQKLVGAEAGKSALKTIRRARAISKAFLDVRRVEQSVCISALQEKRVVWIVSDWGLATDDFLRVVQERLGGNSTNTYQLDLHDCKTTSAILSRVQEETGCNFENLCTALALDDDNLLIFDDVPVEKDAETARVLCGELQVLIEAVLDYCPQTKIVIRSRLTPPKNEINTVELRPLDEPDTAAYIKAHDLGGDAYSSPEYVNKIYRNTNGIPTRIDTVIKYLHVVGMSGIFSLNTDVAGKNASVGNAPEALIRAIDDLESAEDPIVRRAFALLKVLTIFPQGEQLIRVRRFNGTSAFYPAHASVLLDGALVDAVDIPNISGLVEGENARALVVRRPVREYLYERLSASEIGQLNRRALTLYFGESWATQGIKSPSKIRFDDAKRGSWEIGNASTMVLRAVCEAQEIGSEARVKDTLCLATGYCAALLAGDHFRSVASLCDDIFPVLEQVDFKLDLALLTLQYGKAVRMVHNLEKARDILVSVDVPTTVKSLRQEVLINLALCYQSMKDYDAAIDAANRCLNMDDDRHVGLQAKSIIARLSEQDGGNTKELQALEAEARKEGAHTVANNIALQRAERCDDPVKKREILEVVASTSFASKNKYTATRAVIKLAALSLDENNTLDSDELAKLIDAYHYLYSERIDGMFRECNEALWRYFESQGETENLLRLFRHSSFIWRLRGFSGLERNYLSKLLNILPAITQINIKKASQELAYFLTRASHALSDATINNAMLSNATSESVVD